jgi:phospholipase/carboxylesterase
MATIDALKGPMLMPTSGTVTSAVVLLHGYGSNGDDLIGLAPYFARALPQTAFYSPNAPQMLDGGFMGGFQWFSLGMYDPDMMRRDPARMAETFKAFRRGATSSAVQLNAYIDQILAYHALEPNRLALLGFSQGTMMSLHVGPRRDKQIAGILGYSGALTGADALDAEVKTKPPVALVHGDADAVVPYAAMTASAQALKAAGIPCETHTVRGLQHSIDAEGAEFGAAFLKRVLT